jgi:hypothetical protein
VIVNLSPENIERLYEKVERLPEYQGYYGKKFFIDSLYDSLIVFEFSWGIIRLTDLIENQSIQAHGLFLNKGVIRDIRVFRELGDFVLKAFDVKEINIIIPSTYKSLEKLLSKSCFKKDRILLNPVYNGIMYEKGLLFKYKGEG